MDYTTIARVKTEMQAALNVQDTLLSTLVTAASRAIDRHCTGTSDPAGVDYFKAETKTDETLNAIVDSEGNISTYIHKPIATAVTAFAYRMRPFDAWVSVDVSRVYADGPLVKAWPLVEPSKRRCQVKLTYTGGLAAATASLPEDLQEAATILVIRYFKEAESGLSDAVGLAELNTMTYTKAWPVRVLEMLQPYVRTVSWRLPSV